MDMFCISEKQEFGFDKIVLEDLENCRVEVVPEGAMLHAMKIYNADWFNIIDSYPDKSTFVHSPEAAGFKGLKLSPFPCRIKNASYEFEGNHYHLQSYKREGDALHGFLYNQVFVAVDRSVSADHASVTLEFDHHTTDSGYPFPYRCRVVYTLEKGNHLTVATTITNTGTQNMPIADGWHPYFTLGEKVDNLQLQIQSDKMLEFENLLPTGRVLENVTFKEGAIIGAAEIDNSFVLDQSEAQPMCTLQSGSWQLSFYPDNSYPYLQIYIPPHRNSIAIENLSAPPDALNNKMSLTVLPADGQAVFTARFVVKKLG